MLNDREKAICARMGFSETRWAQVKKRLLAQAAARRARGEAARIVVATSIGERIAREDRAEKRLTKAEKNARDALAARRFGNVDVDDLVAAALEYCDVFEADPILPPPSIAEQGDALRQALKTKDATAAATLVDSIGAHAHGQRIPSEPAAALPSAEQTARRLGLTSREVKTARAKGIDPVAYAKTKRAIRRGARG